LLVISRIAPLPLLFKGRGGGEGLGKYQDEFDQRQQITQNLLFLHSKLTVCLRYPLTSSELAAEVKDGDSNRLKGVKELASPGNRDEQSATGNELRLVCEVL
jgi:hypothetical protein